MKAKEALHGLQVSSRNIEVYYAIPAPTDKTRALVEDRENDGNSGVLSISLLHAEEPLQPDETSRLFEKYGEIRSAKPHSSKKKYLFEQRNNGFSKHDLFCHFPEKSSFSSSRSFDR